VIWFVVRWSSAFLLVMLTLFTIIILTHYIVTYLWRYILHCYTIWWYLRKEELYTFTLLFTIRYQCRFAGRLLLRICIVVDICHSIYVRSILVSTGIPISRKLQWCCCWSNLLVGTFGIHSFIGILLLRWVFYITELLFILTAVVIFVQWPLLITHPLRCALLFYGAIITMIWPCGTFPTYLRKAGEQVRWLLFWSVVTQLMHLRFITITVDVPAIYDVIPLFDCRYPVHLFCCYLPLLRCRYIVTRYGTTIYIPILLLFPYGDTLTFRYGIHYGDSLPLRCLLHSPAGTFCCSSYLWLNTVVTTLLLLLFALFITISILCRAIPPLLVHHFCCCGLLFTYSLLRCPFVSLYYYYYWWWWYVQWCDS